jgi:serine/threonine protein phosphatase PrpC
MKQFVADMKDETAREDMEPMESVDESGRISRRFSSAYQRASTLLVAGEEGIDAAHSGTTATSLFITKDFLHTANVGDSRCLLIKNDPKGKTLVEALTVDHTPEREDEIKRIEAHGGVVMAPDQYDANDPTLTSFEQKRIWSKAGKWPGTAFTRSIGDAVAKELGVCADPECANFPIPTTDAAFVLGSDGVFDFIPDEEIGDVVMKFKDPAEACRELIGKAWNRWCESEERTDDITVIVGHVKHSERGVFRKLRRRLARSG